MSIFEYGSEVWIRDEASVWEPATVIENRGTEIQVETVSGSRPAATVDVMPREDASATGGQVQDLTELTHLNEPSILHALVSAGRQASHRQPNNRNRRMHCEYSVHFGWIIRVKYVTLLVSIA